MSTFINNLSEKLEAMEREMQAFPEELNSIVRHLDRGEWEKLVVRVNDDFNKLLDKLSAPHPIEQFIPPMIFDLETFSITPVTSEDKARWRTAHKSEIRVVIGEGRVQVMTASEITCQGELAVSDRKPFADQPGYIVLTWDQYQKLLDEISKLIGDGEEPS